MGLIQNTKSYSGRELDTIFFRPIVTGEHAEQLGIRMLYNMPVPTTIQVWDHNNDILQEYSAGWSGGSNATRLQKEIAMKKIKAEIGFSASDYFNQIFEHITCNSDVNLEDLTGSELEMAETELFRRAIAENLRIMMWAGNTSAEHLNLFDGFISLIDKYDCKSVDFCETGWVPENVLDVLKGVWDNADERLRALRSEGNLAFFVSSEVYNAYENALDQMGTDQSYIDMQSGRRELTYHGIPVIDIRISHHPYCDAEYKHTCILTDRRNLVFAVNTKDYPGSEVRMWYNPDEMENRQRATFLAGCEILDEDLVSRAIFY